MFISVVILSFLSMLLAIPFMGISLNEFNELISSSPLEMNMSVLKFMQMVQTIGLFILPAVILNYLIIPRNDNIFIRSRITPKTSYLVIVVTLLVSIPVISYLIRWNLALEFPDWLSGLDLKLREMEDQRTGLTEKMLSDQRLGDYLVNLVMIAVLPALGEEFFFRGIVQKILIQGTKNIHWGIILTATFFSVFHLQFFGFLPRLALGIYFGYLLIWSGNIWIPVFAHFINNAFAVSLEYFSPQFEKLVHNRYADLLTSSGFIFLFSILLTFMLLYYTYRSFRTSV